MFKKNMQYNFMIKTMFKKRDWKKLKVILRKNQKMKKHYQKLFEAGVSELQFEKLRNEHFKSVLFEVKDLCEKGVSHNLIKQVVQNGFERDVLDKSIHNNLIAKRNCCGDKG